MSYDISIGGWDKNYTHNSLGPLCYAHLDEDVGLRALDGMTGAEALQMLADFWEGVSSERHRMYVERSIGDPLFCAKYDAPNGWGSLVGALTFMGALTAACAQYPSKKIHVCA